LSRKQIIQKSNRLFLILRPISLEDFMNIYLQQFVYCSAANRQTDKETNKQTDTGT